VLDCTIRDGGLINNHNFDFRFVREVFKAVSAAGMDYIELGYKNSREVLSDKEFGPWMYCDDDDLKRVTDGIESRTKISVMADVGRCRVDEVAPAAASPVDMIRVSTYLKDMEKAITLTSDFAAKGYDTTINIMAISKCGDQELEKGLHLLKEKSPVQVVYIVDSFGALFPERVGDLVLLFRRVLPDRIIGFHGHNHQQLAFANTVEAGNRGAGLLDGTVFGMGRAAGNCPLELLASLAKARGFDLRPILDLISREFIPMRKTMEWGYIIPYAITGMLNEHPRKAMELRKGDNRDDYGMFYDSLAGPGRE
jgi:4-hydroxy 2-oxovalerate aldolase